MFSLKSSRLRRQTRAAEVNCEHEVNKKLSSKLTGYFTASAKNVDSHATQSPSWWVLQEALFAKRRKLSWLDYVARKETVLQG